MFIPALPFTSVTVGNLLPCPNLRSRPCEVGEGSPSHWKPPDFSGGWVQQFYRVKNRDQQDPLSIQQTGPRKELGQCSHEFCPWYFYLDVQMLRKPAMQ